MANRNDELRQEQQKPIDGNFNAGGQNNNNFSNTSDLKPFNEITYSNCTTTAASLSSSTTTTVSPDLGLGIDNILSATATTSTPPQQQQQTKGDGERQQSVPTSTTTNNASVIGIMRKSATTTAAPTQNAASTFSFKHFLSSSSSAFTAPSTTVTSLDPICNLASSSTITSTSSTTITTSIGGTSNNSNNHNNSNPTKSTGARPKVPQSASLAIDALCGNRSGGVGVGMDGGSSDNNGSTFGIGSTRMKRSPRFSSFDSQASLAEYVAAGSANTLNRPNRLSLHPTLPYVSNGPLASNAQHHLNFQHNQEQISGGGGVGIGMGAPCVGMDLQMDNCSASNSLPPINSFRTSARRSNQNLTNNSSHKLDLPIDSAAPNIHGPSDFPSASASASAAVLPDFVQDHYIDTYLHDMHLNSPRNSPTRDFSGGAATNAANNAANIKWSDLGAIGGEHNNGGGIIGSGVGIGIGGSGSGAGGDNNINSNIIGNNGGSNGCIGGVGSGGGGVGVIIASSGSNSASGASKMLPDFLSDGPIIHSSQRLADVAAGLPSNSVGSPEDPPITSQLSHLRLENERLQRELSEMRTALCEQTRRANDLEHQLEDENRRRALSQTTQQIARLKQQLTEMSEKNETLRRENETLREEGAVGGLTETGGGGGSRTEGRNVRSMSIRPQQISQALLRAASNAENNLRQLLTGVDNLRQMAADIEGPGLRLDYDGNSDIYSEFLDECEGFEDFSGGPAL